MSSLEDCCWLGVYAVSGPGVDTSAKEFWEFISRPGVELKTEYSSANVGVQPLRSSKLELLFLGVWKTGLGN
jgi:hypothetical protein